MNRMTSPSRSAQWLRSRGGVFALTGVALAVLMAVLVPLGMHLANQSRLADEARDDLKALRVELASAEDAAASFASAQPPVDELLKTAATIADLATANPADFSTEQGAALAEAIAAVQAQEPPNMTVELDTRLDTEDEVVERYQSDAEAGRRATNDEGRRLTALRETISTSAGALGEAAATLEASMLAMADGAAAQGAVTLSANTLASDASKAQLLVSVSALEQPTAPEQLVDQFTNYISASAAVKAEHQTAVAVQNQPSDDSGGGDGGYDDDEYIYTYDPPSPWSSGLL